MSAVVETFQTNAKAALGLEPSLGKNKNRFLYNTLVVVVYISTNTL
jgi:hypothetical protein